MAEATIRELGNHGGEVVDRVAAGERLTVTRDGRLDTSTVILLSRLRHPGGLPDEAH